jgi:hypothetical protein
MKTSCVLGGVLGVLLFSTQAMAVETYPAWFRIYTDSAWSDYFTDYIDTESCGTNCKYWDFYDICLEVDAAQAQTTSLDDYNYFHWYYTTDCGDNWTSGGDESDCQWVGYNYRCTLYTTAPDNMTCENHIPVFKIVYRYATFGSYYSRIFTQGGCIGE